MNTVCTGCSNNRISEEAFAGRLSNTFFVEFSDKVNVGKCSESFTLTQSPHVLPLRKNLAKKNDNWASGPVEKINCSSFGDRILVSIDQEAILSGWLSSLKQSTSRLTTRFCSSAVISGNIGRLSTSLDAALV